MIWNFPISCFTHLLIILPYRYTVVLVRVQVPPQEEVRIVAAVLADSKSIGQ